MANTLVSLFDNANDAEAVVRELTQAGFSSGSIKTTKTNAAGNVVSTLTSANVPEESARFYQEGVKRGGTLVTLDVEDNDIDRAMEIIERHNVVNIEERATQYRSAGFTDFDLGNRSGAQQGDVAIPVVEEELRVGKRAVASGGVRIFNRVTERPVEETVRLREEHVNVERRPVNRPVTAADANFREGTIEMTATSEEAIVDKQARVVEEVVVNKQVTERDQTVRDTVRRTDVEVEQIGTDETTTRTRGTSGSGKNK